MSHGIRTPMNSILGFTDLLKETETDNDKKEYLGIIIPEAKRGSAASRSSVAFGGFFYL